MFKLAFTIALAALFTQQALVSGKDIPVGGFCSGIAGPVGTCVYGSRCCDVSFDLGLCAAVDACPTQFVPKGGLCISIAGPSRFPCFPGTKCCTLGPDNGVCKPSC